MSQLNASRRQFLRTASVVSGSVGAAAAPFALNLASLGTAVAQTSTDYKAIVCLFLYGGNDSSNMVLRTDTASFAEYTRMRNTGNDPIALLAPGTVPNGNAVKASPARLGGVLALAPKFTVSTENAANTYAVHPSMPEVAGLFAAGRLAVLANAGPLVVPLTRADYTWPTSCRGRRRSARTTTSSRPGRRSVRRVSRSAGAATSATWWRAATPTPSSPASRFRATPSSRPARRPSSTRSATAGRRRSAAISGSLFNSTAAAAAAFKAIVTADNAHPDRQGLHQRSSTARSMPRRQFQAAYTRLDRRRRRRSTSSRRRGEPADQRRSPCNCRPSPASSARAPRSVSRRQVFFVSMGGFDTHDNQNPSQADLMARLSHALGYFDGALANLGGSRPA